MEKLYLENKRSFDGPAMEKHFLMLFDDPVMENTLFLKTSEVLTALPWKHIVFYVFDDNWKLGIAVDLRLAHAR